MKNSMFRKGYFLFSLVFFLFAGLTFATTDSGTTKTSEGKKMWQKSTVTATIQNVNKETHEVTLKGPEGKEMTFNVDKGIDLSNLKNGDTVKAEYYRSIAMDLSKPTADQEKRPFTVLESKTIAPADIPIAGGLRQIKAVATVKNINKDANTITLEGPQGREITIMVPMKSMLEKVKEGQKTVITYTEGLATTLEKTK